MKGYRTIVTNIVMIIAALAALWGVDIPPEMQKEVVSGILSIFTLVNLLLRKMTTTPLGKKE